LLYSYKKTVNIVEIFNKDLKSYKAKKAGKNMLLLKLLLKMAGKKFVWINIECNLSLFIELLSLLSFREKKYITGWLLNLFLESLRALTNFHYNVFKLGQNYN
jgi:hypothetical protein